MTSAHRFLNYNIWRHEILQAILALPPTAEMGLDPGTINSITFSTNESLDPFTQHLLQLVSPPSPLAIFHW